MKIRKKLKTLVSLVLAASFSLFPLGCSKKGKDAIIPMPPEIVEVSTNVKAALGDTISTTDIDGKTYTVMIPANSLTQDTNITLRKSSTDFFKFQNVISSTKPLEIILNAQLQDSIYVSMPISEENIAALSNVDNYFRYEEVTNLGNNSANISLLRNSSSFSTNSATQANNITTWVGNVNDVLFKLNRGNADLSDPNKPVVLAIPGFTQNSLDIKDLVQYISQQGFGVMTLDYPTGALPRDNALRLKQELSKLGAIRPPIYMVDYSMGGILGRFFVNFYDTNNLVKKIVFIGAPNKGILSKEAVNEFLNYLLNRPGNINILGKLKLGPLSLVEGHPELALINKTGTIVNVDYYFLGGDNNNTAILGNLSNLLIKPHDGLVSFSSLDMNSYTNHETARLHSAIAFNLDHSELYRNTAVWNQVVSYLNTPITLEDRVLITSNRAQDFGGDEIYETDSNFTNFIRRTASSRQDWQAVMSPDKTKVAYISSYELRVANSDFSNDITRAYPANTPQWHPNSNTLVYDIVENNQTDICKINSDGTGFVKLTTMSSQDVAPLWNPDGLKIIFASDRDGPYGAFRIYTMDPDGGNVTRLMSGYPFNDPKYSPDGSKILYSSIESGPKFTLWISNNNGSNLQRLTSPDYNSLSATWSPDGSKLLFLSDKDNTGSLYPYLILDVYTMNVDGTNLERKTFDHQGYKSPFWYRK